MSLESGRTPVASIVVVTRNGAANLPVLMAALRAQTALREVPCELVVVDNGSTDGSAEVVRSLAEGLDFPVTLEFEVRPGKALGLNRAVALARGEIIAFTDDDGVPAPDWIEATLAYFSRHPEVDCIGGRVELYDRADAAITIRTSRREEPLSATEFPICNVPIIGCNLAIRKEALVRVGGFDATVGPGSRIGSGDDIDLLYRLLKLGRRVVYVPSVVVQHKHGRRGADEVAALARRYVLGRGAFYLKYSLDGDRAIARAAYWELRSLGASCIRAGLVTRRARDDLRTLWLLLAGAGRHMRHGQRPLPALPGAPR